jgi:hypothetical protein
MAVLRRLLVVFAVIASVAGFASSRALAVPPPDCTITQLSHIDSAHFTVWYDGDLTKSDYITETQAGNLAASAEVAYAAYQAMGFPLPVDNGSGMIDIQVLDLTPWGLSSVICYGAFDFNSHDVGNPGESYAAGVDVFSEVEYNLFTPSFLDDLWLPQGAGSWASWRALNYPASSTTDLGPFDMSLDCYDENGASKCSKVGFENLGASRWPFYEYLTERFGVLFVKELLQDAETADDSLAGLQNALAAHGTNLTDIFNAYATKVMTGGWDAPSLNVATLPISGAPIFTGATTGDVPAQLFNVNHLATRYVEIDRGDGAADHACFAATLTITVQIPPGVASKPAFYWNGGGSAVDLAISGNTATTTVPWDTCMWVNKGYLSLPNPSTTINGKKFSVSTHLTVDTNTPATAKVPPAPATPFGPTLNVPWADVIPSISIFGPELLKVAATATQIRLIVESSGEGSVTAAFGTLALGAGAVRPGENDLRFTVPKGALTSLRRSTAAGATLLTLTPVSLNGTSGPAVMQQVTILPAAKQKAAPAKKKAAPAAKKQAKPKAKPKKKVR